MQRHPQAKDDEYNPDRHFGSTEPFGRSCIDSKLINAFEKCRALSQNARHFSLYVRLM